MGLGGWSGGSGASTNGSPQYEVAQGVEDLHSFALSQEHMQRGKVAHLGPSFVFRLDDPTEALDVVVTDDLFPPIQQFGEVWDCD